MRVLKFGGTSVGRPERMHEVAQLINDGIDKVVVMSAVSGTTNNLVKISEAYKAGDKTLVEKLLKAMDEKYQIFVGELYSTMHGLGKGKQLMEEKLAYLASFEVDGFGDKEEKIILAQGELISTHLFSYYAEEIGMDLKLLHALDFMKTRGGEPDLTFIKSATSKTLETTGKAKIYLTQGYICRNEQGEIDNLQRGGSDYTATLLGAALNADEIQIWTDIDGMHNNDPRVVDNTFPVHHISFDEAAELAYFGAKILHPTCVLPAKKEGVPIRLLNTMQPEAEGTLISNELTHTVNRVKAVAAKDGITAIRIQSSRMLNAYGFLKKVFEVFEKYKTSVDMITTSEVAVSLTIDDAQNLDAIIADLEKFATVDVDKEMTIVCVAGEFHHDGSGIAVKVLEPLRNIPLRMISSGGSESNISVLINSIYKKEALSLLNQGLFADEILSRKQNETWV